MCREFRLAAIVSACTDAALPINLVQHSSGRSRAHAGYCRRFCSGGPHLYATRARVSERENER